MKNKMVFALLFLVSIATVANGDLHRGKKDFVVKCDAEGFTVKIAKSAVKYYNADELILNDPSCNAIEDGDSYTIKSKFTGCGTTRTQDDLKVVYNNVLTGKPDPPEKLITKKADIKKPIYCIFDRNQRERLATILQPSFPFSDQNAPIKKKAKFTVSLQLSDKDGNALDTGGAIAVVAGTRVYFSIIADTSFLKVSADRCYVTPTNNPKESLQYNLLKKGCPVDETVRDEGSIDNGHRYSFESFAFVSNKLAPLFVHCTALSCRNTEDSAACVKDCSSTGGVMVEEEEEEEERAEEVEEGRRRKRSSKKYQPSSKRIGSLSAFLIVN